MKNKVSVNIKEGISKITIILPFTLSFVACSRIESSVNYILSLVAAIILSFTDTKKRMPIYISFLIVTYISTLTQNSLILICATLSLIIVLYLLLFNRKTNSILIFQSIIKSVMLTGALYTTVMLTTDYFGIGAIGKTAKEMISSYLSLGFHPNWRGVLYGTIVMVIMITFPRKFKEFSKIISAPFIALIITTVLNLFLNPLYMNSAIQEIGIARIPLHSCAVILIVGAWQSVNWKDLKECFESPLNIICFAITVVSIMLFGIVYGMIITAFVSIIYSLINKKIINS